MRHFDFLSDSDRNRLFLQAPRPFGPDDDTTLLAVALGATLYIPATRPDLAANIRRRADQGVTSIVICLEDAIADDEVADAERNVVTQLRSFGDAAAAKRPLIFLRVRTPEQIPAILTGLREQAHIVAGFVLPKFSVETGPAFFDAVVEADAQHVSRLFAMPVLESPDVIFSESRVDVLLGLRRLLGKYRENVLAIRIGATDLSAVFGLRRSRELTVYDLGVIADAISDMVNIFARLDGTGFVVTGPVWEYFSGAERMFKPQLRDSPFAGLSEQALRTELITKDLDGLIREVALDKANGLTGKTVIHPTHVAAVHALSVVTHEEYCDAADILGMRSRGGVRASVYRNKMNESKPHSAWATRVTQRAHVFGVANEGISFVELLAAGLHR
ncbi:HpcH/HpaI aldolase/citrate lyase family protein [Micromonospora chalcea]|uniref:HpcH/HpaI aldolase/citrate lyase family protein n=1 Tax=Micromonospora chalcea TaxID=1874 RepID=UPI0038F7CE48